MKRIFLNQCQVIVRKKMFIIVFGLLLALVSGNFIYNVYQYYGMEVSEMYSFAEIGILGDNNDVSFYFLKFYPFFLVLPAALSVATEQNNILEVFWVSRCGRGKYYFSKLFAVFTATFLCFFLPLLWEMVLNSIAFPMNAHGNMFGYDLYSKEYRNIEKYMLFQLYFKMPVAYVLIQSLFFSFVSGVFAVFTSAAACIYSKYKAYLLLPVYLLIYFLDIIGAWKENFKSSSSMQFSQLMTWCQFAVNKVNIIHLGVVCLVLVLVSVVVYFYKMRRDII